MSIKIFDCFIFYNELDILELRLEELYDVVDKFVLVEANCTFSGNMKPWFYLENKDRYSKYNDKIIYIQVEDMPQSQNAWDREKFQRNAISRSFPLFEDNDIILISDVDEIPRQDIVNNIKFITSPAKLEMDFYNYNFNCRVEPGWIGTVIFRLGSIRRMSPQELRFADIPRINKGGWHFSWFGDEEFCKNKIRNFSHQELNNDYTLQKLGERMKKYEDYYQESGRGWKFILSPLEITLPQSVLRRKLQCLEKYIVM